MHWNSWLSFLGTLFPVTMEEGQCHIRYFAAHDINSSALGEQKSVALPLFHSFIKQAIAGDRL